MRTVRAAVLLAAGLVCGCGSTQQVTFRSPPASELVLSDPDGLEVARVTFPGNAVLPQNASPGDELSHPVAGQLRINDLIEEARVPSNARSYLVSTDGGVSVKVRGFWQAFTYDATPRDLLVTHFVDVSTDSLLLLLGGQPIELEGKSPSGKPVWKLTLGLDVGG